MKNMSVPLIAFTVAGSLVGAGFASGQELWQFFGAFGIAGIAGLVLSLSLFALLCYLFIAFCIKREVFSYEKAVFPNSPPFVRAAFSILENLLFFFLCVIMTSGASEAVKSFISTEASRSFAIVFALGTAALTLFGIRGLTRVFSLFVPIFIFSSLFIFYHVFFKSNSHQLSLFTASEGSGMLNNFFVSSLLYLSYSFFASVGILSPLARQIKNKKSALLGSVLGTALLILVALAILMSMLLTGTTGDSALPMLEIAGGISPTLEYLYSAILICAMFACSLTSSVAFFEWFDSKIHTKKLLRTLLVFLFTLIAWYFSRKGFTNLISTVYPMYGYVGFIIIAAVLWGSLRRQKNG